MKYFLLHKRLVRREIIELHTAVFLFGFAGLFGKILNLSSTFIVFGRVLFASIFLLIVIALKREKMLLRPRAIFLVLGIILALHWLTFFQSIQLSTVAIGLITYSTFPIFTTLLEPLFFYEKLKFFDLILAIIVFFGILIMVPSFKLSSTTLGIILGTLSGFLFSLLTLINRKYVQNYSSLTLAFYQDSIAAIFLLPFLLFSFESPSIVEWEYLIILGVIFTGLAHTLFISSLWRIKAQSASIVAMLEPVYGIILAFILLAEIPALRTIIGGIIILSVCFYVSMKKI